MTIDCSGVVLDMDGLLDTEQLQMKIAPRALRGIGHELDPSFFNRLVDVPQAEYPG